MVSNFLLFYLFISLICIFKISQIAKKNLEAKLFDRPRFLFVFKLI